MMSVLSGGIESERLQKSLRLALYGMKANAVSTTHHQTSPMSSPAVVPNASK